MRGPCHNIGKCMKKVWNIEHLGDKAQSSKRKILHDISFPSTLPNQFPVISLVWKTKKFQFPSDGIKEVTCPRKLYLKL